MVTTLEADYNDTSFPLTLSVNQQGVGGVAGLAATCAIRDPQNPGFYLDWTTLTFKNAGWGVKNQPMTDEGNGGYQVLLNVQGLGFTPKTTTLPKKFAVEYTTPAGNNTGGFDTDTLVISELRPDAKRSRQYQSNRLESLGGNPGTLTLYDDDGVTQLTQQTLLDWQGQTVDNTDGTPAKRGGS